MDSDLPSIQRLQCGDEEALVELMRRHKAAVFRLAWRYTWNEQDAADVTEETFVKAYFKAGSFSPKAKVKTWLLTIAANLSRDLLRRKKRENSHLSLDARSSPQEAGTLLDLLDTTERDAQQSAEAAEKIKSIQNAIHALPHKLKLPFVFCVIEGYSQAECAELLKESRKTVETRIYRARQHLRKCLAHLRE